MNTSIPTNHLNFYFLSFLFVNFLYGRAINLLINANNDCSIRVSQSFARCLGSKAAACKTIFNLPYMSYCPMHLSQKVHVPASLGPGLSGPSRTIACWIRDVYKSNFLLQWN